MRPYIKVIFLLIVLLNLSGCSFFKNTYNKARALRQCSFELVDVTKKVSFVENTSNIWNYVIDITIHATNNSMENISLGRYQLDLYANDKWLSKIETDISIRLEALNTTPIHIKAIIKPSGVIGILLKKLFKVPIEYKINGIFFLSIGDVTIPIEKQLIKYIDSPNN